MRYFTVSHLTRPASILKNRQPRGSYSFDENITTNESLNCLEDGTHLKPILKNKSWSIEEKVSTFSATSSHVCDSVKGILKSSDKVTQSSPVSSSSSRKNSAVDDSVSCYSSLPCSTTTSAQSKSIVSPVKATLRGILKTSPKNRSASISPGSSSDSLVDEPEIDHNVPLSPRPTRSAIRRKSSLDGESSEMSINLTQVTEHGFNQVNMNLNQTSISSARPTLKKANALSSSSDSLSPTISACSSLSASSPIQHCFCPNKDPACVNCPSSAMSPDSPIEESESSADQSASGDDQCEDDCR